MVRGRAVTLSIAVLHVVLATWLIGVLKPEVFRYVEFGDSVTAMLVFDEGQLRLTGWFASDPPAVTSNGGIERYGFGYRAEVNITPTNKVNRMYRVMMPMWALLTVCGFYPIQAFLRGPVTRMRRRRLNCCAPCGYSLIGNVSGICPECGSIVSKRANNTSHNRPTYSIEVVLWRWFELVTSRRGVVGLVALALLWMGVDLLRDRPWESPAVRAYRICRADGLTGKQIETAILGFQGGFAPGSPVFKQLSKLFSGGTVWSEDCDSAMKDVAGGIRGIRGIGPIPFPLPQLRRQGVSPH